MHSLAFQKVNSTAQPEFITLQPFYGQSFPEKERRDFGQLGQLLSPPEMHLLTAYAESGLAEMYVYWQLSGCCFLEHLAVAPQLRGQGIGTRLMQHLARQVSGSGIVLEVERPQTGVQQQRVNFYERLGFVLHPQLDYHQPPYRTGHSPVPLFLMSSPALGTLDEVQTTAALIAQEVYRRHQ
ncbi:GNAT family N-acetyltransferase [Pontibacter sp. CAU 1760]